MVENRTGSTEADAAQGYGRTWKRVAGMLGQLAPLGIESVGRLALKFHIPDGKYRQQVFALEDTGDGVIYVYLPDVTALAITRKVIKGPEVDGHTYLVVASGTKIELESISADSKEAAAFCKPMLGWGRKALRVKLAVIADETQLQTVEQLCELAAEGWAAQVAAQQANVPPVK